MGQIGNTEDFESVIMGRVIGTANVFGNGPYDLFLFFPTASFLFKDSIDQGTPYYGKAVKIKESAESRKIRKAKEQKAKEENEKKKKEREKKKEEKGKGDEKKKSDKKPKKKKEAKEVTDEGMDGTVVTTPDNEIFCVYGEGRNVLVTKFDRGRMEFVPYAKSERLDIPGGVGGGMAARIDANGKLDVYFSISDGAEYRLFLQATKNLRLMMMTMKINRLPFIICRTIYLMTAPGFGGAISRAA